MSYHRGSVIIVSSPPRGLFREGTIKAGETPSPGTIMQISASAGLGGDNNWTYEVYNADADGGRPKGPLFILREDPAHSTWDLNTTSIPGTTTEWIYSAYAAGDHCFVYTPMPGEEFNLLIKDVSGTGAEDAHSAGDMLIPDDGTGTLVISTGSDETEPFMLLSAVAITGIAGNILAHVIYTGY